MLCHPQHTYSCGAVEPAKRIIAINSGTGVYVVSTLPHSFTRSQFNTFRQLISRTQATQVREDLPDVSLARGSHRSQLASAQTRTPVPRTFAAYRLLLLFKCDRFIAAGNSLLVSLRTLFSAMCSISCVFSFRFRMC